MPCLEIMDVRRSHDRKRQYRDAERVAAVFAAAGECDCCRALEYWSRKTPRKSDRDYEPPGLTGCRSQDGFDSPSGRSKPISCNPPLVTNTLQPEYAEWNNGWRAADNYEPPEPSDYGRFEDFSRYRADMQSTLARGSAGSMTYWNPPTPMHRARTSTAPSAALKGCAARVHRNHRDAHLDHNGRGRGAGSEEDAALQRRDRGQVRWLPKPTLGKRLRHRRRSRDRPSADPDDARDARIDFEMDRDR